MQRSLICILMMSCNLFMNACKKDDATSKPTASISAASQSVSEGDGTTSITVSLPEAQSVAVTIKYTLSGTAVENGDYRVTSDSVLTIAAGSTSATLTFELFDDSVVEASKEIIVEFSSSAAKFSNSTSTITITDNDNSRAASGLNTDLTWDGGSMVDLDLYYANNVTISNNSVSDYNLLSGSTETYGFESLLLSNNADDGEYYIVVAYTDGSRVVNYTLTYNAPNITDEEVDGQLTTSQVGYALFYGPVTKSGSSYSKTINGTPLWNLKEVATPHLYKGKLKKY